MTALILFTRELAKELRAQASGMDAMDTQGIEQLRGDVLRRIADAIDAAAKRAFHL